MNASRRSRALLQGCLRKRVYRTREHAEARAEDAIRRTGELIHAYYCPDCFNWHIGHEAEAYRNFIGPKLPACIVCGRPIPPDRIANAEQSGNNTETCSQRCARLRRARKKRLTVLDRGGPKGSPPSLS